MNDLFLRALGGAKVERRPLWIMRQAGRYLPEYRAVREKVDFLTLCRTPDLAAEVTFQPLRRFELDAAIVFSDIMMPLEAMGVQLEFTPGPVVRAPIRSRAAVDALRVPAVDEIAPYVMDTIKILRRELKVPLIGFSGAPWTLAAYLVEGKGSKDFSALRQFMYADPEAAQALFHKLAQCMAVYLRAQVQAGAQVVQLFDTWAGLLSERDYRTFVLPGVQFIMSALADTGVPRIYFAQDAAALWPAVRQVPCEAYGVDWRTDLSVARQALGPQTVLQGNLDPAALFAPAAVVRERALLALQAAQGPHIFNLGHGILPHTPVDSVHELIATVHQFMP